MANTFELDISKFVAKCEGRMDAVVRKLSLELFTRVVLKTPVDTGRARGNWQLAIGSIPSGTLEVDDTAGTLTIGNADAASAGVKAGDVVYIANSLPYIRRLEYGWSGQAPDGMVRTTIAEIQQWLANAVGEAQREQP